jgi:DNA polymerase-4
VAPSHGRYGDVSAEVFAIFRSFTPLVEGLSLDEAFLDVRGLRLHFDSPVTVAVEVRRRIRVELGLPASVGVAAVKFVAKLASETAKPDGLRLVTSAEQPAFLETLPATALWGVGPATLAALARLGVETVGDIAGLPVSALVSAVGPSAGKHLHDLANGIDPRPVVADIAAKSVSVEETYESDLATLDLVETALLAHAQRLSDRLRRSGLRARTVTLKVRWQDFTTVTRSETIAPAVDGARDLYRIARDLMAGVGVASPVRLLGLSGTSLEPAGDPAQLGMSTDGGWVRVEDAVADIRARYGVRAVGPARLVRPDPPVDHENQRKNPDA